MGEVLLGVKIYNQAAEEQAIEKVSGELLSLICEGDGKERMVDHFPSVWYSGESPRNPHSTS